MTFLCWSNDKSKLWTKFPCVHCKKINIYRCYWSFKKVLKCQKTLKGSAFFHTLIIFISNIQHKGNGMVSWKSVGIYKIFIKQRMTYINMRTRTVTDDCKYCPNINFTLHWYPISLVRKSSLDRNFPILIYQVL